MSLYVALLAHCSNYLENSVKVVHNALYGRPGEGKDVFMPKAITRDQLRNANFELLNMATIGDRPLTSFFVELFDNFMEHQLAEIVQYVNMSEDRRLAALEYKREKFSVSSLTKKMLDRLQTLEADHREEESEKLRDHLREISQLQTRVMSLEVEVAALREGPTKKSTSSEAAVSSPGAPKSRISAIVATHLDGFYANQLQGGGEEVPDAADHGFVDRLYSSSDAIDAVTLSSATRIAGFSNPVHAERFAEVFTSTAAEQGVPCRCAVYVCHSPIQNLESGPHVSSAMRLLLHTRDQRQGSICLNVEPRGRVAGMKVRVVAQRVVLSHFLGVLSDVWVMERLGDDSSDKLGATDQLLLWHTANSWADKCEQPCTPLSLWTQGAPVTWTLPSFSNVHRSKPEECDALRARVMHLVRNVTELNGGIELSVNEATPDSLRVACVFQDVKAAIATGLEAIRTVEDQVTWPKGVKGVGGSVSLQATVSSAGEYASAAPVDGDVRLAGEAEVAADRMQSLARSGELVVTSSVAKCIESEPELAGTLMLTTLGDQPYQRVEGRDDAYLRLKRRSFPSRMRSLLTTRGETPTSDGSEALSPYSHFVVCGIDAIEWLSKADPNATQLVLDAYEPVLRESLIGAGAGILSYDQTTGAILAGFPTAIDAMNFGTSIHLRMMEAPWDETLLSYRDFAHVKTPDERSLFRGARLRVGVASGEGTPSETLRLMTTAFDLADFSRGGETIVSPMAAASIFGQSTIEVMEPDDRRLAEAHPGAKVALPSFLSRRRLGYLSDPPGDDRRISGRSVANALRKLRLADLSGVRLEIETEEPRSVEAEATDGGLVPAISVESASAAINTIRRRAWKPGAYIGGVFEAPRGKSRVFTAHDGESGAQAASNRRRLPPMPLTWERYETLRGAFEDAATDRFKDHTNDDGDDGPGMASELDLRSMHTSIHKQLSSFMPRVLELLPPATEMIETESGPLAHFDFDTVLRMYFPDAAGVVVNTLDEKWRDRKDSALHRQLEQAAERAEADAVAAEKAAAVGSHGSRRPSSAPRNMSMTGESNARLMRMAQRHVVESETICRHFLKELAMEKYRFFATAWTASTKEETARAERKELDLANQRLREQVADQQTEIIRLKNLSMETAKLKEQVKHAKTDAVAAESSLKRVLAKGHYAASALHAMTSLMSADVDAELDGDADKDVVPFSREQLLDEWYLLFDSVQVDSIDPYTEVHAPQRRTISRTTAANRERRHDLITNSVIRQPQEISESSTLDNTLLSTLTWMFRGNEELVQRLIDIKNHLQSERQTNRTLSQEMQQLQSSLGALQAEHAALQRAMQEQKAKVASNPRSQAGGDSGPGNAMDRKPQDAQQLPATGAELAPPMATPVPVGTNPADPAPGSSAGNSQPFASAEESDGPGSVDEDLRYTPPLPFDAQQFAGDSVTSAPSQGFSPIAGTTTPPNINDSQHTTKPPISLDESATQTEPILIDTDEPLPANMGRRLPSDPLVRRFSDATQRKEVVEGLPATHEATLTPHVCEAADTKPAMGTICECCQERDAVVVCKGCWGASLCSRCISALHAFIPQTLLERSDHVLESTAAVEPFTEQDTENLARMGGGSMHNVSVVRQQRKVLVRRLPTVSDRGVWHPRDVAKSVVVSNFGLAPNSVPAEPVRSIEAATPPPPEVRRPRSALSERLQPPKLPGSVRETRAKRK